MVPLYQIHLRASVWCHLPPLGWHGISLNHPHAKCIFNGCCQPFSQEISQTTGIFCDLLLSFCITFRHKVFKALTFRSESRGNGSDCSFPFILHFKRFRMYYSLDWTPLTYPYLLDIRHARMYLWRIWNGNVKHHYRYSFVLCSNTLCRPGIDNSRIALFHNSLLPAW